MIDHLRCVVHGAAEYGGLRDEQMARVENGRHEVMMMMMLLLMVIIMSFVIVGLPVVLMLCQDDARCVHPLRCVIHVIEKVAKRGCLLQLFRS